MTLQTERKSQMADSCQLLPAILEQAVQTLKALPRSYLERPGRLQSVWPKTPHDKRFSGISGVAGHRPSPADIDRLHIILEAFWALTPMQRQLIWARAMRLPWQILQKRFGRSRAHLASLHQRALTELATQLILLDSNFFLTKKTK